MRYKNWGLPPQKWQNRKKCVEKHVNTICFFLTPLRENIHGKKMQRGLKEEKKRYENIAKRCIKPKDIMYPWA